MPEPTVYQCCGGVGTHTQFCVTRCPNQLIIGSDSIRCAGELGHAYNHFNGRVFWEAEKKGWPPLARPLPSPHAPPERINHPNHYGGADNPYEVIKVIDAWGLGFCLGNTLKYVYRAGKKPQRIDISTADKPNQFMDAPADVTSTIEDLKKAAWYLNHEIEQREKK